MPRSLAIACALLPTILAAAPVSAQPPGALATARADIDGDGKTDEVRVSAAFGVEILFAGAAKNATPPIAFATVSGAREGSVEISNKGKEGRILAVAEDKSGEGEAVWLRVRGRRVTELWRGRVAITDADTGTRLRTEAIGGELYRFHDNPAITRCDKKQSRLNIEKLVRNKFVAASAPPEIDGRAGTINASAARPAGVVANAVPNSFTPRTSSSDIGMPNAPDLLAQPVALGDRDARTAWVEGRPGAGRGEYITLRANKAAEVLMVRIVTGNARDDKAFAAHNRPKRIGLVFDSGDRFWVNLADDAKATEQWIVLPSPVRSRCVSLILDAVYPTANDRRDRGNTAISEIAVLTKLDVSGKAGSVLVDRVLAGGADAPAARRRLKKMGAAGAKAVLARLARGGLDPRAALSLRRILAAIGSAPDELAIGLGQREATDRDREEMATALAGMGKRTMPSLRALIGNRGASGVGRARAAVLLSQLTEPSATDALIAAVLELAGDDSQRAVRATLAKAIGSLPVRALPALTAAASRSTGGALADVHRAIGLLARASGDADAVAAAVAVLEPALGRARGYEERYRLLAALGALADERAVAATVAQMKSLAGSSAANDVALRRVAAMALGKNQLPAAATALAVASSDSDAGVRNAAVAALAQHTAAGDSDKPLAAILASDPWPSVRRNAAGALAARCDRDGPRRALRQAAIAERDARVGQIVLSAVVRCGGAGTGELLIKVALTAKRPTQIRVHAIQLLGQTDEPGLPKTLIELFEKFVRDSFSEEGSIALAQAAAGGLCRAGDRAAVAPLADAAENSAYPEIQAAAARALGCFCAPETAGLLRTLAKSSKPAVSVAATSALGGCKKKP